MGHESIYVSGNYTSAQINPGLYQLANILEYASYSLPVSPAILIVSLPILTVVQASFALYVIQHSRPYICTWPFVLQDKVKWRTTQKFPDLILSARDSL